MAKEWHPDKNKAPEAQERFVEITKAYELLNDPERRRQYDNFGVTEDTPNFRKQHDYSQFGRFDPFDAFQDFFGSSGGGNKGENQLKTPLHWKRGADARDVRPGAL